ncbi:hypothetical protein [uncultured Brevundimonas sp.]|uniref:hypothetical protein n=1 Tax=uncultured Brevundimonas sp. TaxID=213418 RepID=UPI00261DAA8D|nr:hypothetical protein [uncultured Brevundimonas sp.]
MIETSERPAVDRAEGRWFWRRLYVYLATMLIWVLLRDAVRLSPPEQLRHLADGLMGLIALMCLLYLVAPSAQQIVNLARGHRGGDR